MNADKSTGRSSEEPAEGRNDIPPPERGSPVPENDVDPQQAERTVENDSRDDANPLAPPVNTHAGS